MTGTYVTIAVGTWWIVSMAVIAYVWTRDRKRLARRAKNTGTVSATAHNPAAIAAMRDALNPGDGQEGEPDPHSGPACDGCSHPKHLADNCTGHTLGERCECDEPLMSPSACTPLTIELCRCQKPWPCPDEGAQAYPAHRRQGAEVPFCTRPDPHQCRLNGPCNGLPRGGGVEGGVGE
jgi:hypothetical protein